MGTLDRYILRRFIKNYTISMFVLMSLYVVLHLFVNLDEFTETVGEGQGVGRVFTNICDYYGYNLFLYFAQLSGAITLFAGAVTLAQMQRANELTAVLSSGVSLYRVAAPVALAGLIMSGLWVVDQELILPRIAHKLARPPDDVEGQRRVYEVWFMPDRQNNLVSSIRFHPQKEELYRMIVFHRDDQKQVQYIISADRGIWMPEEHAWKLERGILFRSTGAGLAWDAGDSLDRVIVNRYPPEGPSDLTPENIRLRQALGWQQYLSLHQLVELERKNIVSAAQIAPIRHGRVTQPIGNLLLLLLGIPFFLNRQPGSVLVAAAKCLATCGTCFMLTFLTTNVLHFNQYPAFPAWLPLMIFGPVAVICMDRVKT
jgi:lipopolysaccharide export system permease protein